MDRYVRHRSLREIGAEGQRRIEAGRVLIVGCGALGCTQASLLVRAGVGFVRLVDPDTVALHNLHRQLLFVDADVGTPRPKVEIAAARLREANPSVCIEALPVALDAGNVHNLLEGVDLALDATDSLEPRFVLNLACVQRRLPWIHGAIAGAQGLCLCVLPDGPCLRCLYPEIPPAEVRPTAADIGVLNAAATLVASLQVVQALALLSNNGLVERALISLDAWTCETEKLQLSRRADCSVCGRGEHPEI